VRIVAVAGLVTLLAGAALLPGCRRETGQPALLVAGGDPALGPALIRGYGCHTCHTVPGVRGANALVGPPLNHWSQRAYIAGLVPNTPENLVAFIFDPRQVHPETAMPMLAVTPEEARHMAAYLFTLR
jgi:cytochrome c